LSDKQIARELTISLATAKTHVHNLLGKLLVKQRREVFGILVADTGAPFRRPASLAAASRQLVLNPVH
jgi:hypothetical protein